jgi:hypothetical protein
MKPRILFLSVMVLLFIVACNQTKNEDENIPEEPQVFECKSTGAENFITDLADSLSCINYAYNASNRSLVLEHINAGFNCCPEMIGWNIEIIGDSIIVEEYEQSSSCLCNCLFDLRTNIQNIDVKNYVLKIIEPYRGDQEEILFNVDLEATPEGSYCVSRYEYPWGISQK